MRFVSSAQRVFRSVHPLLVLAVLGIFAIPQTAAAQSQDEFDNYKVKLDGYWVYSNPSGTFQGANDSSSVDLQGDLHFNQYSTFVGKIDWKFTHKNHLYVQGFAFNSSREVVLERDVTFQGQTFLASATVQGTLNSPVYVLGYQYDIIRRRRGHLGIAVQANIFDTHASIKADAQIVGGVPQPAAHASASILAPLPVAGPEFRYYLTNSPRVFIDGNVYGMYFFGYGNFISTAGVLGVTINKHLAVKAGYQLGSRLVVNASPHNGRLGITMTQQGPLAGVEISF
jgi:hypothetical protein